jgi:hypothetical protein
MNCFTNIAPLALAARMAVDNPAANDVVRRARDAVQSIPNATETALRNSEGLLRARIVTITHELMYLLQMRDLLVREHELLLARIEDRTSKIDLTV